MAITLLDYFEQIYIINLPSRTDRKYEMQVQLTKIGLSLDNPQIKLFTAVRPDQAGDFPSIGARGCYLSHLGVLKEALRQGLKNVLILEDDLNFFSDFLERIPVILDTLAQCDWGMFYGGYQLTAPLIGISDRQLIIASPKNGIQTTHFVGFHHSIIPALVEYLENLLLRPGGDPSGGPMHVDGAYSWFRRQYPDVVTLLAVPELGYQRSSRTDISELRWYDRWAGVRLLVQFIRLLKNR